MTNYLPIDFAMAVLFSEMCHKLGYRISKGNSSKITRSVLKCTAIIVTINQSDFKDVLLCIVDFVSNLIELDGG